MSSSSTASTFATAGRRISFRYRSRPQELQEPGLGAVLARFRDVYQTAYGVALDAPAELVTYRVRATCPFAGVSPSRFSPRLR